MSHGFPIRKLDHMQVAVFAVGSGDRPTARCGKFFYAAHTGKDQNAKFSLSGME
jgi:hypothetical protein